MGHPRPVLRLRVQQGAHRRRTAWSPTGPRTSRPTTRPSTWRRCSPASATTRTSRRSTWPSAGGWASRCCRPTSTRRVGPVHRGRHGHPVRPGRRAQRRRQRGRVDRARAARRRAHYTDFYDFLRKVDAVACNKKTIESLIKAGAFDSLGHTRKGLLAVHADAIDSFLDVKRNEAVGPVRPVRRRCSATPSPARAGMVVTPPIPDRRVGQVRPAGLRAGDARPLRLRPPAVRPRARAGQAPPTCRSPRSPRRARSPTARWSRSPASSPACSAASPSRAGRGRRPSLEDLGGAVEVLFFPNTYELVGQYIAEDAIVVVKGRVDRRDDQPRLMAMDMSIPDITARRRRQAGRAGAAAGALHAAAGRAAQGGAGQPPGHGRGAPASWSTAPRPRCCGSARCGSAPTTALMADLKALLGPSAARRLIRRRVPPGRRRAPDRIGRMTADRPDPAEHASGPWAAPPVKGENQATAGVRRSVRPAVG